ncbi:MAG: heavy metal translocating P-type ATPase [Candidatus Moranbacteria bacterium]|nr:heavy metal translocating P-type ATPase [Candidatus Moranbacteria bacterium]
MGVFLREMLRAEFRLPILFSFLIFLGFVFKVPEAWMLVQVGGLMVLVRESWGRIRLKKTNLDYLALFTIITAFFMQEWLTGAVIALMVSLSESLERYGTERAESTLKNLFYEIPKNILLYGKKRHHEVSLHAIVPGDVVVIRSGEMLPIEGRLISEEGIFNESNITGESMPVIHRKGSHLKAGFVNTGESIVVEVESDFEHSSYRKILEIVEQGKVHSAPLVRLSERYNLLFTLFSVAIAVLAYVVSGESNRFLAVLVLATPCPLLIAVPLSFLGGLNRAAKRKIIVKSPFILELLAKTKTLFFDKTGTLTIGQPMLRKIVIHKESLTEEYALSVAASLERHSIHPLAKVLVARQEEKKADFLVTHAVKEVFGEGITGTIDGNVYSLKKTRRNEEEGIQVDLWKKDERVASFFFDDGLKPEVEEVLTYLKERGYRLGIITGDHKKNAERVLGQFNLPLYADATPERKLSLVAQAQKNDTLVGMIGDGMNDALALSMADLGIVFSGTENAASLEAADVAILGRDIVSIREAIHIGRRSYTVAYQSLFLGIGLSTIGMITASFGYIDPVHGALIQELIDFCVIMNALRSTY